MFSGNTSLIVLDGTLGLCTGAGFGVNGIKAAPSLDGPPPKCRFKPLRFSNTNKFKSGFGIVGLLGPEDHRDSINTFALKWINCNVCICLGLPWFDDTSPFFDIFILHEIKFYIAVSILWCKLQLPNSPFEVLNYEIGHVFIICHVNIMSNVSIVLIDNIQYERIRLTAGFLL